MKINFYTLEKNEEGHPVMVAEPWKYQVDENCQFDNPKRIVNLVEEIGLSNKMEEYLYLLCLDSRLHFLGFCEVSHGAADYSVIDSKSIFQRALLLGAVKIILIHNHPSGNPAPSKQDIECTKKISKAGELLDIPLLDHIIVAKGNFCSMREKFS